MILHSPEAVFIITIISASILALMIVLFAINFTQTKLRMKKGWLIIAGIIGIISGAIFIYYTPIVIRLINSLD